ncbi:MATE family efflux transporter [Turicibacter sanguinis]|uniref:MATE family efflux transporter n=1 Tax=Turicibacter sanguinis TaxID=154288 RepID=UPI00399BAD7B
MKRLKKEIMLLGIPILIEQILNTTMGMMNTMLSSNLKGQEGINVVSAISMIDSFSYLFISVFTALAIGGTVVVAQYMGRGDCQKANEAAKQGVMSATFISILITIFLFIFNAPLIRLIYNSVEPQVMEYGIKYFGIVLLSFPFMAITLIANGVLRGAGDTKTAAISNVIANIFNIGLTYLFLYVFEWGIIGAALGISLARAIGASYVLWILMSGKKVLKLEKLHHYKPNFKFLRQIFYVGVPAGVESIIFHLGKLLTQVFIGGMGAIAMSSNSIANSIINLINIPGNALTTVSTTIIGQEIGRAEYDEARKSLSYITRFATICLVILGALSIPTAWYLVALYTDHEAVMDYATKLIQLNALATPIWAFSFVLPGGLKGAGDGKYTMKTAITGMWVFRVGLGYLFGVVLKWGVYGIFIAMFVDWAVRGTLYMIRLRGDKWLSHRLTDDEETKEKLKIQAT